jgi:hypothetical protein
LDKYDSVRTFAEINRIEIPSFNEFDVLDQTDGVAHNRARLLKSLGTLDVAANAFAAQFDILEAIVQYLVNAAKTSQDWRIGTIQMQFQ